MCKLWKVGDRMEAFRLLASMFLGINISHSAATLNFLSGRNELISLVTLFEK